MPPYLYDSVSSSPDLDENTQAEDETPLLGQQHHQIGQESPATVAGSHRVNESTTSAYPRDNLVNYDDAKTDYDPSEDEPENGRAGTMAHASAVSGISIATCLWMIAMTYLAVIISAANFYGSREKPLPLLFTKQKLSIIEDFIRIAETQANISMDVIKAIGHARATNFTLARSAYSLENAADDLDDHLGLLERMTQTPDHHARYGEAPDCLPAPGGIPTNVLVRKLREEVWNLSVIVVADSTMRFERSVSYNRMFVNEALKWLDFYAKNSTQSTRDVIDDAEDDATAMSNEEVRVANVTAPEVLWVMDDSIRSMCDEAKGDSAILRQLLNRLKAVEVYSAPLIERYQKCVLPATEYMQLHLARRNRTYSEGVVFRSRARHPHDDALSLLNIGLLPHLDRLKEAAEALGEQSRRWEGSSESLVARYEALKARISQFKTPSRQQRAHGQPWLDTEHAVHWWVPGLEDVYEDLSALEEYLALVKAKVVRAVEAIDTWDRERGFDDSDRERRMWKDERYGEKDLLEKLKALWDLSSALAGRGMNKLKMLTRRDGTHKKMGLYELLQVPTNATNQDLKKAYRLLTLKYHPDKNPGNSKAARKYQDLVDAYHILSDSGQRTLYDRYGEKGLKSEAVNDERSTDWVMEFFKVFPN